MNTLARTGTGRTQAGSVPPAGTGTEAAPSATSENGEMMEGAGGTSGGSLGTPALEAVRRGAV